MFLSSQIFLINTYHQARKFLKSEDGASAIEYIIIVAMVALVIVGLSPGVKTSITDAFTAIKAALPPAT